MKSINHSLIKRKCLFLFLPVLFLSIFSLTLNAQSQASIAAPISQLTLNADGDIQCDMHAHDAIASEHQNMANDQTAFNAAAQNGKMVGKQAGGGADIFVSYFNFDPNFSTADFLVAVNAFQSAVDVWAATIDSDVPIFVAAVFQPLGPGVLGSAGPTSVFANSSGLEQDTWYGNALADKLVGEDLTPQSFDIVARFSTVFPNWYYGTDGNTPAGDFDFKTVVLHELCHGLGFFGSMFVDNASGVGSYGFGIPNPVLPAIYDRLMSSEENKFLLKENRYPNFSTELGDALLNGPLNAKGPRIKIATNGKGASIFTTLDSDIFGPIPGLTDVWLPGSSYSHLDFVTYAGGPNGLMVPFLSRGLSYDSPGAIVEAIFDDIGWNGKVNSAVNAITIPEAPSRLEEGQVSIFPNPTSQSFQLKWTHKSALENASIIDATGRRYQLNIKAGPGFNAMPINLKSYGLSTGMYTVQLSFEDKEVINQRIVIRN